MSTWLAKAGRFDTRVSDAQRGGGAVFHGRAAASGAGADLVGVGIILHIGLELVLS